MVTIGSGISSWMKVTTGDIEETAVRRLNANSAIVMIATYLAANLFN
jgi:hypothetical protein